MLSRARALFFLAVMLVLAAAFAGCSTLPALRGLGGWFAERGTQEDLPIGTLDDSELSLAHLQLKGSHNSYHRAPRIALSPTWRYTHAPLEVQLEKQGVRQVELDVRYDRGEIVVGHLPIIDGRASCTTMRACLTEMKRWSRRHPTHLPVFVFLEPKEHVAPSQLEGRYEVLDREIRRVFPREDLLTPEDVVGNAPSIADALRAKGWPSVEESRGKFAFVLFGTERHPRNYARGRPRLEGRTMFAAGAPSDPWAGVVLYDDPVRSARAIDRALKQHLLVRTRADANLVRDAGRRDAALSSGAHFLATDFVDPRHGWLDLGRHATVRCNPVTAAARCSSTGSASFEQALWAGLRKPTSM